MAGLVCAGGLALACPGGAVEGWKATTRIPFVAQTFCGPVRPDNLVFEVHCAVWGS